MNGHEVNKVSQLIFWRKYKTTIFIKGEDSEEKIKGIQIFSINGFRSIFTALNTLTSLKNYISEQL